MRAFLEDEIDAMDGASQTATAISAVKAAPPAAAPADGPILLVGSPNVGKSALFNRLTGRYVTVSNYPGTTVEVARGVLRAGANRMEVIDTPGMYSLAAIGEEERVTCRLLLSQRARAVLHVIDAKNIERMLGLTLQLIEAGLPVILVLNMADEARRLGIKIDCEALARRLNVPVIQTVATNGKGIDQLLAQIPNAAPACGKVEYDHELEQAIGGLASDVQSVDTISPRTQALLLLQDVHDQVLNLSYSLGKERAQAIDERAAQLRCKLPHSVHYHVSLATRQQAQRIVSQTVMFPVRRAAGLRERISRLCMNPITGAAAAAGGAVLWAVPVRGQIRRRHIGGSAGAQVVHRYP